MRFSRGLIRRLSLMLEEDEREAVLGDFAESGTTTARAVTELLGLIATRQAALWADWRPWVALTMLVIPVGYLLSLESFRLDVSLSLHFRTLWTTGERYHSGLSLGEQVTVSTVRLAAVMLWTWSSGFVLGSLARRTAWVHGALFCLVWFSFCAGLPVGGSLAQALRAVVFFLPAFLLLLLPSVLGALQGLRLHVLERRRATLLSLAGLIAIGLLIWTGTWQAAALERWSEGVYQAPAINWLALLPRYAVLSWPIAYILAISMRRPGREVGDPA